MNGFVKKYLKIILFWASSFVLVSEVFAESDGYLGIYSSVILKNIDTEKVMNKNHEQIWAVPFGLLGGSENSEILMDLRLFDNMPHISSQFSNLADYIQADTVDSFAYAFLSVRYSFMQAGAFLFHAGAEIGHRGYIYSTFEVPHYTVYISPLVSVSAFLGRYFMLQTSVHVYPGFFPFMYRHNINRYFSIKSNTEISFDPIGPIRNPEELTIFMSIGMDLRYTTLKFESGTRNLNLKEILPYFKFTLLY